MTLAFHSPKVTNLNESAYGFEGGGGGGMCPLCPPMSSADAALVGMASAVHDINVIEHARNENIIAFFMVFSVKNETWAGLSGSFPEL